jgi:hypothetical protein
MYWRVRGVSRQIVSPGDATAAPGMGKTIERLMVFWIGHIG